MRPKRRGFTLVELMIVITIIGILIALILRASISSIRNAEHAATVALIAKLESALTDRLDALTSQHGEITPTHTALAGIYPGGGVRVDSVQRAQVIADYDRLRAELPDVFVLESDPNAAYKLNFAAERFNVAGGAPNNDETDYFLPLGANSITGTPAVTGTRGASFASASAIYKQLGFSQKGLDGADNDGDFLIDEWDEGTAGLPADQVAAMVAKLGNHKHKTARAEMAYAILVEGTGPLGSVFNKDDFNGQEVKDTDGDGLLEFVDAWGEPLQFYRWPIMYKSDTQKGFPDLAKITLDAAKGYPIGPYGDVYEAREQDPLDPNQTLLAPGWWGAFNSAYPWSGSSAPLTFGALFHTVVDPLAVTAGTPSFRTYWDRSTVDNTTPQLVSFAGMFKRRAYYSRFLVLSGGPDKQPGVAMLGVDYTKLDERGSFPLANGSYASARDGSGALVPLNVTNVIRIENQAGKIDPNRDANGCPAMPSGRNDTNTLLEEWSHDDITSHNLHASGGALPTSP